MIEEIELRLASGDVLPLRRGQQLVLGRDHVKDQTLFTVGCSEMRSHTERR